MMKKIFFLGSICAVALLASCGNKNNSENAEAVPAGDTVVEGTIVEEVAAQGDTVAVAVGEAVDTVVGVGKEAADKANAAGKAAAKEAAKAVPAGK